MNKHKIKNIPIREIPRFEPKQADSVLPVLPVESVFPDKFPEPIGSDNEQEWEERYQNVREEQMQLFDEEEKLFEEVFFE